MITAELKTNRFHNDPNRAQRDRRHLIALVVIALLTTAVLHHAEMVFANELEKSKSLIFDPKRPPSANAKSTRTGDVADEIIREVTAYNAGDPAQTDESPCISANGENVCQALALGQKRCAANFVPFGTRLHIESFGECMVVDRMNRRYKNRVDIAMNANEKQKALKFGVQNLVVRVLR